MKLTEKQAEAIYQLYLTMNHNNSYVTNLLAMKQKREVECLMRAMDKIAHIAKIEDYSPVHFTWLKRVSDESQLENWLKNPIPKQ